ncbi:hypothetical protein GOB94_11935 [Granulicella sp. 5B5]|uniref:hypothetical protein n=1 Tax=Granulicella sp. 5B5 TaxID=1617967 RepID=UPI0015F480C3|nr:hypothetical protein [Granulicella sp. 5B5]QMV19311.1 hypothetical protein GOB94_11935 [Granulicella sp. 5B5]
MAQDWYTPQPAPIAAPSLPPIPRDLRPLSLGEILDRTFSVYRSRFWLFAGIAAIYSITALLLQLLNLLVRHHIIAHYGFANGNVSTLLGSSIMMLLLLVPYAVTEAGTVFALSEVYLGNGTSAQAAVKATIGRWYRYIGIAFWVGFAAFWPLALLWIPAFIIILGLRSAGLAWLGGLLVFLGICSLPYSIWSLLRNLLAIQSSVIEGAPVRAAIARSKLLTKGAKGRIFVVLLIVWALTMTAGMLQLPLTLVVLKSPLQEHNLVQSVTLIVNALAQMVVIPIGLIGLSLVYFDQRVRQEGFDLLLMLGPEPPAQPVEPPALSDLFAEPPLDPADTIGNDGRL